MFTGAMLSQRHAAERLGTCWHGGGLSLDDVRKQMRDALDEFLVAGSGSEVAAVSKSIGRDDMGSVTGDLSVGWSGLAQRGYRREVAVVPGTPWDVSLGRGP